MKETWRETSLPVVVFVHGGAWGFGFKEFNALLGRNLANKGIISVLPSYTLYPTVSNQHYDKGRVLKTMQGSIEQMLQDIADAVQWTYTHIQAFGGDSANIHISGHSAGAHLVGIYCFASLLPDVY